jgi:DNA-directed RNA polymerase subunit beta'
MGDARASTIRSESVVVRLGLAGPDDIRGWSCGEVTEPATVHTRSGKPVPGGLFCERIFGPVRDWACRCGRYAGATHGGHTCERCGTPVLHRRARRQRMGHVELAAPVVHVWFVKARPSPLSALLGLRPSRLEKLVYGQLFAVLDPGPSALPPGHLLQPDEARSLAAQLGPAFRADTGADAILHLLRGLDVEGVARRLRAELTASAPGAARHALLRRLRAVKTVQSGGSPPEWMVLRCVPVIPPTLRPVVRLEGGKFASSELNDLYRRLIKRNNRLRRMLELGAPAAILRHEKRLLQQAADALFDNLRGPRPALGPHHRPAKSLSDLLGGKQGRFRANLLGKRVDYSARAVIVVGPELKLHQCGLPRKIALKLYEPFLVRQVLRHGFARTIRRARQLLNDLGARRACPHEGRLWALVEEVTRDHPVLLNRAPTLHRMGIQAFEPVLVEGLALRLHPLVCRAFNADFDGDQMAVHLPLSVEAQVEAKVLLMSTGNLFNPANGQPIVTPSQDIVLGCHYLTTTLPAGRLETSPTPVPPGPGSAGRPTPPPVAFTPPDTTRGEGATFASTEEALLAHALGRLGTHARVAVRLDARAPRLVVEEGREDEAVPLAPGERLATTAGRVVFNSALPAGLPFYNLTLTSRRLARVLGDCHRLLGPRATVELVDRVKQAGFAAATRSGLSFATDDIPPSPEKELVLAGAGQRMEGLREAFRAGKLDADDYALRLLTLWADASRVLADRLLPDLRHDTRAGRPYLNPLFALIDSGARGNLDQLRQLAGMRGLMASVSGRLIERPITASLREGLPSWDYFLSAHGARKGLTDKGVRTAEAGYLTRKLVDAAQQVVVTVPSCHTERGVAKRAPRPGERGEPSLAAQVQGRVSRHTLADPTGRVIVHENELIRPEQARALEALGLREVWVRSPLTCAAARGVCRLCYGADLATGRLVEEGMAVGVLAAQSIGEPGTQLTLRTFRLGGLAGKDIVNDLERVTRLLEALPPADPAVLAPLAGVVRLATEGVWVEPVGEGGDPLGEPLRVEFPAGKSPAVRDGERVVPGQPLTEGAVDPTELLAVAGPEAVQEHLLAGVRRVYRHHGLEIDDRHFEVILARMLRWVQVTDPGDSDLLPGQVLDREGFRAHNDSLRGWVKVAEAGDSGLAPGQRLRREVAEARQAQRARAGLHPARFAALVPAGARPHLVGISRVAGRSEGFLAAASFQRAVEVLTEAALAGRADELLGPKENVLLGRLIPAGTGLPSLREARVRERARRPPAPKAAPRRGPATTEVR